MFGRKKDEAFVSSPMRDNWYQSSSYWPSSFALVTTVDEDGNTNIGPYQLSFPFEIITGRSFLVISRQNSNTDQNLKRTGKAAMNFVEFDRKTLSKIVSMGYPGQLTNEKMKDNPYTLIPSPTRGASLTAKSCHTFSKKPSRSMKSRGMTSSPSAMTATPRSTSFFASKTSF